MIKKISLLSIISFCTLVLIGCAASPPLPSEDFNSIRNSLSRYEEQTIRLGGKVTSVSITNEEITMEILSIPLSYGQPLLNAQPDGRFVAVIAKNKLSSRINLIELNGSFVTVIGQVKGRSYVDNRIGYFSTFLIEVADIFFFDFKNLALSQQLIEEKNNSLEEIRAIIEVKIAELRYLRSLLPTDN